MKKSSLFTAAALGLALVSQPVLAADAKKATSADKTTSSAAKDPLGECHGANSCKGKSLCGSKDGNSCSGQNSCKGKGWVSMTKSKCLAAGKTNKWAPMGTAMHNE